MTSKRIVLTGASGSGKTSLVEYFSKNFNIKCIEECVRSIPILERQKLSMEGLQEQILMRQIDAESKMLASEEYLLDRSIIDYVSYCNHFGLKRLYELYDNHIKQNKRYDKIFFLESIPTAYHSTYENYSVEIQQKTISKEYMLKGYQLINIPYLTIEKRAEMIMNIIGDIPIL